MAKDISVRLRDWWLKGSEIWKRDDSSGAMLLEAACEIDRLAENLIENLGE